MSKVRVILTTALGELNELIIIDEKLTDEELLRAIDQILNRSFNVEYE